MVAGLGKIEAKATKTLKNVAAKAAQKTSRAKRKSDEVYNARRRAKRKLERELKKTNKNQQTIDTLRAEIEQSYATKQGEYLIDIEQFQRRSRTYTQSYERKDRAEIARKNDMMRYEINQASSGGTSKYSKEETKIFYAATKRAWEGKPQGTWNEAIMEYYGVDTLEEAWDLVFSTDEAKKALQKARQNQQPISSESDLQDGSTDEKEDIGSPDYIKELILTLDTR